MSASGKKLSLPPPAPAPTSPPKKETIPNGKVHEDDEDDAGTDFDGYDEYEDYDVDAEEDDEEEEEEDVDAQKQKREKGSQVHEEDEGDEEEDKLSEEEKEESPFLYKPSEEDFVESDLRSRRKRRYLIGTQSFLELVDPQLENALEPGAEYDEEDGAEAKVHKGLNLERDNYRDLCKQKGFTPNPTFLKSLGHSTLDLRNQGLSSEEIAAIATTLCVDKHVERLLLGGNSVGREGGMAIAEMITKNYTVEELELSNAEILEALEEICEAVAQTTSLISLDLSKNELLDQDMLPIAAMLGENHSLRKLYLAHNQIKDWGLAELGQGLLENAPLNILDLSGNKIKGTNDAFTFFKACGLHPSLRELSLRHNLMRAEGASGLSRIIWRNDRIQKIDLAFNLLDEGSGHIIGKGVGTGKSRELEELNCEQELWHQAAAAAVLRPFGNWKNRMPISTLDFGWMLDVHKTFLTAKEKALKVHPELKIIHGLPYGMGKAKGPEEKPLVIRRANVVCENFETPLVMLMEELAKEPPTMPKTAFRKFIKVCNLYKDGSLTEAFENVFATPNGDVDAEAIIAAFDKEYPGKRVIPDPSEVTEVTEEKKKKKKKGKKGGKKGKKGKSKAAGDDGGAKKGKGTKKGGAKLAKIDEGEADSKHAAQKELQNEYATF